MKTIALTMLMGMVSSSLAGNVVVSSGDCVHGNGEIKTETRNVAAFSAVDTSGAFHLEAQIGSQTPLRVTADSNILPLIVTDVAGGRLRIFAKQSICTSGPMSIALAAPEISQISANGSNTIEFKPFRGSELRLKLDGSNDVRLQGQTNSLKAEVSGASTLDARALRSEAVEVSVVGAGTAYVNAVATLNVSIIGAGEVYYAGQPRTMQRNVMGVGTIEPIR